VEERLARDLLDTEEAGPTAIRGGLLRVGGYVAGVALSVGSAALLLRYLGPSDFGRYSTIVSLVTIVGGITEAGMTNIGVREWTVLPPGDRQTLLDNLLGIRLVLTVAGVAVALGFGLAAGYEGVLVGGIVLGGVGLLAQTLQATLAVPLQAELRLGWVTALELVRQGATVLSIVALVAAGTALLPFFAVPIVASLAALAATLPLLRGRVPLRVARDWDMWRELTRVTLPYALATAAGLIYAYLSIILMSLVSTDVETGYFAASFRVFVVLTAIPGLIVSSAFPILARAARDDIDRLAYGLQRLFDAALIAGTLMAVVLVLGAEIAIAVVAGDEFEPAVSVLQIQGAALLATFLAATWSYGLLSLGRFRALLVANAAALVVSAALTLGLGPSLGAEGAAIATLCGETVLAVVAGTALLRNRRLRLDLTVAPRVTVASAAGLAPLLLPGLPVALLVVVGATLFLLVLHVLGGVPDELREALADWRRQRRSSGD
jgi:O-antigen/teichoic acid export membrane protein